MVDDVLNQGVSLDDEVDSRPEDMATSAHTSGTTGYPKGATSLHRTVVLDAAMFGNMQVRTAMDTVVHGLPLPHEYEPTGYR